MLAFRSAAPQHARPEEHLPTSVTTVTTVREREVGIRVATGRRVLNLKQDQNPKPPNLHTTPTQSRSQQSQELHPRRGQGSDLGRKSMKNGQQRRRSSSLGTQTHTWHMQGNRKGLRVPGEDHKALAATGKRTQTSKIQKPPHQNHPECGAQEQNTARPRHPPTRKTMNLKQQGIKRGRDQSKALADRRARTAKPDPSENPRRRTPPQALSKGRTASEDEVRAWAHQQIHGTCE